MCDQSGLVGLGRSSRRASVGLVNGPLGLEESGSDDLAVDELGTLSLGKHKPNDGEGLDGVVPGNVVEDDAGEGLKESEHAENDPVGEPLDVILGLRALERLEREVGGDEEADQVGQETSGTVGRQRSNKERSSGTEVSRLSSCSVNPPYRRFELERALEQH